MEDMTLKSCRSFAEALASDAPTPGGGGASALAGALVQVNIATDTMIRAMEQVLAATSALTRGKEAADHE